MNKIKKLFLKSWFGADDEPVSRTLEGAHHLFEVRTDESLVKIRERDSLLDFYTERYHLNREIYLPHLGLNPILD